jgi:hypothetical protein
MSETSWRPGVLAGMTVVALEQAVAAPLRLLADLSLLGLPSDSVLLEVLGAFLISRNG